MVLLAMIAGKPMFWWLIVPLIAVLLWVAFLMWESRIPPKKLFLRFKGKIVPHKHTLRNAWPGESV